jgi:hypothetical protein
MIYKINKNVLIEESLLNHIRDNKNAYAAGAAGLGAAGLGTYLAMSSGDHTGLDNHDKERELQQKLDAANEYDSGIRVGAPLALAGGAALVHLGLSAATGGKTAQNIANGIRSGLNNINSYRNDMANARNNVLAKQQAELAARRKAAETPSTKYNPPKQPKQPRQPRAKSKI